MRGLSARLLVLTIVFVMLSEVLIYVPSIARFREVYLKERIAAAQLASLTLKAAKDFIVSKELTGELLARSGLRGIIIKQPDRRSLILSLDMPGKIDASYDLRGAGPVALILDAFETLLSDGRNIRVIDAMPGETLESYTEIIMSETAMRNAMVEYSVNILQLSIVISLITATLVYLSLHILLVRPMQRMTASMNRFRKAPEDDRSAIEPSRRSDEVGAAESELARMQGELRAALQQRAHLAALGAAVSKVSHDLRNILATAQLVSDRLAGSEDPLVQRIAPTLVQSIDRAIELCARTLSFGRADEQPPQREDFALAALVEDVALLLGLQDDDEGSGIRLHNQVPAELTIRADKDQLFRVLLNVMRNSVQALGIDGEIHVTAQGAGRGVTVQICDNGPGLPEKALENLFEPFAGSARAGGTGLGLAIARELIRGHGGDMVLVKSDASGTIFQIDLPSGDDSELS